MLQKWGYMNVTKMGVHEKSKNVTKMGVHENVTKMGVPYIYRLSYR